MANIDKPFHVTRPAVLETGGGAAALLLTSLPETVIGAGMPLPSVPIHYRATRYGKFRFVRQTVVLGHTVRRAVRWFDFSSGAGQAPQSCG